MGEVAPGAHPIVVLGAGLAGLSTAQRLAQRGLQATLFEAKPRAGGHASSFVVDGFTFDEGPHVSFTKHPEIQLLFEKAVEGAFIEQSAEVLNLWRGHWLRHPAQCNLYGLPTEIVERCVLDFLATRSLDSDQEIATYAQWCERHLGESFSQLFVFPYTRKYWATDPEQMAADWVGGRVYAPKVEDVVRGALRQQSLDHHYITRFRYPARGGFGAFVRPLAAGLQIHYGHSVTAIDVRKRWVEFANSARAHFEVLVSSIPLPELVRSIRDVPSNVIAAAQLLSCTGVVLASIGVDRDIEWPPAHWAYFYDEDIIFSRAHFPHRLSPANVPPQHGSVQVEVYFSRDRPLATTDVLSRAIEDLRRTGILRASDNIVIATEMTLPYANVVFDSNRREAVATIHSFLEENGILWCGRYGNWDYSWSDDSIIGGWSIGDRIAQRSV